MASLLFILSLALLAASIEAFVLSRLRPGAGWFWAGAGLALLAARFLCDLVFFAWGLPSKTAIAACGAAGLAAIVFSLKTLAGPRARAAAALLAGCAASLMPWLPQWAPPWGISISLALGAFAGLYVSSGWIRALQISTKPRPRRTAQFLRGLDRASWLLIGLGMGGGELVLWLMDRGQSTKAENYLALLLTASAAAGAWWLGRRLWEEYRDLAWTKFGGAETARAGGAAPDSNIRKVPNVEWLGLGLFACALVVLGSWRLEELRERKRFVEFSEIAASSLPGNLLDNLRGLESEIGTPAYTDLAGRLDLLRAAKASLVFVYLIAERGGRLVYLADAADNPEDLSPPGYPVESEDIHLINSALKSGSNLFSPPSSDEWGVWVSSLAPVRRVDGSVAGVLGMDIDALAWQREILDRQQPLHLFLLLLAFFGALALSYHRSTLRWGWQTYLISKKLEREQKRLENMLAKLPSGVLIADAGGTVLYANEEAARIFGAETAEKLKGLALDRLGLDGSKNDPAGAVPARAIPLGNAPPVPVELREQRIGQEGGETRVLSLVDLSERLRQEEELRASRKMNKRLALVAQRTDNAVVITDRAGLIEWVNAGFERLTGYRLAEVRGRKPGGFLQGGDTDPGAVERIRGAVAEGRSFHETLVNYSKDGRRYEIEIEAQPLLDESGEVSGFMAIERDVTEERRMRAALATQQTRLERINRCLAELGNDFTENVQRLTQLAGEIFQADAAFYNRLDSPLLVTKAAYRPPPDLEWSDKAEGHLCYDLIRSQKRFLFVPNLQLSPYRESDPNVARYGLETYMGHAVSLDGRTIGSLCVVFSRGFEPDPGLGLCLELIAMAVAREEILDLQRSELRTALESARRERGRLHSLLEVMPDAVIFEDASRRLQIVNDSARQLFGAGLRAGADCGQLAAECRGYFVNSGAFLERIEEVLRLQTPAKDELELVDGRILDRQFAPVRLDGGNLAGYLWQYRDVTRERRSARLFAAVAGLVARLVNTRFNTRDWGEILGALGAAAGVDRVYVFRYLQDGNGVWRMSQVAEWNSGTAEPQIDNPDLQNIPVFEAGFSRWHEALTAGRPIHGHIRDFPEAERRILEPQDIKSILVTPIFVEIRLWGFIGYDACRAERPWADWEIALLRSVSATMGLRMAQLDHERKLEEAREAAESANKAKSAFLATMSHEIRTPLNAVIGMASLLEDSPINPQQEDYVRTIMQSGRALLDLINNILDYSKIESGKIELERVPLHLSEICAQACDIIRGQAAAKGVEIVSSIAAGTADHFMGDPARLRQILLNLLSNAVKFTEKGTITIEIAAGEADSNGEVPVQIEVRDTGIGMSEDIVAKLFSPFYQGDSSTTRRYGGTGLGLVITKRLVESMGGRIEARSKPGCGSSFIVSLKMEPAADTPPGSGGLADRAPEARLPRGTRVLVVDDLETNRNLLMQWLQAWGAAPRAVASAQTALAVLAVEKWDLLLADYHMPEMDGAELIRRVAAMPNESRVPAVMISSDPAVPDDVRQLCAAVLLKPVWPRPLEKTLARALEGAAQSAQRGIPRQPGPANPEDAAPPRDLRVLVAEDNLNNQKIVRFMLKRLGVEPVIVADGARAVSEVCNGHFDLVLLDMQMPEMDGVEAARRIVEKFPDPNERPLLAAFTANAFSEDREAAFAAGMTRFLSKPVSLEDLKEVLDAARARKTGHRVYEIP